MPATPRTTAAPTVTGRAYARRVASLTSGSCRMSAGAWVAEAQGDERRRRAAACRLGRLTGTRAPRWSGEIGEQDWRTVLTAGAAALAEAGTVSRAVAEEEPAKCDRCGTKLNRANTGTRCNPCQASASTDSDQQQTPTKDRSKADRGHLAARAQEFTRDAKGSDGGAVVDLTRNGRAEALVDELLAARPTTAPDMISEQERRLIEDWSPLRNGPRWSDTRRALSGPRRRIGSESMPAH
ncbi:hypothetical protein [Kitasatospora sp. NPDC096204]|uniref:hypothetical protein n=1 Tax=Kitasatospora sp. NPDC096204 TaxID=3364094 RepID=UPI00381B349B